MPTSSSITKARQATQFWMDYLQQGSHAQETHEAYMQGVERFGLRYGERVISTILRPRFVGRAVRHEATTIGKVFHQALAGLMRTVRQDVNLLEELGIRGVLREMVCMEQRLPDHLWFMRLDGFEDAGCIKLVEFNVDSPGGAAFVDAQAEIFRSLPVFRELTRRARLWRRPSIPLMRRCVETAARLAGTTTPPTVAILDWREVATVREFELIREHLAAHGLPSLVADPRDVEMRDGVATVAGQPIHLVLKRVLVTDMAARKDELGPFLEAVRTGAVVCLNPPACQAVTTKSLLAAFHEGLLDPHLSPGARRAFARHIPWTVRLRAGRVVRDGRTLEVESLLERDREQLVLKPSDDYGAAGVVLGWKVSASEWRDELEKAFQRGDYVLQERVGIPTEVFPQVIDNTLHEQTLHVEMSPYTFYPHTTGECLSRLSASDFLNVKTGGGVSATFVLAED